MKYKDLNTLKTYAWMTDTATSSIVSIRRKARRDLSILTPNGGAAELRRDKRRWPATMLADRRIERVKGRITLLTSSIITIKGIRIGGVLRGTKWASIKNGTFTIPINMCPNHRGRANVIVKVRWLEEVNE